MRQRKSKPREGSLEKVGQLGCGISCVWYSDMTPALQHRQQSSPALLESGRHECWGRGGEREGEREGISPVFKCVESLPTNVKCSEPCMYGSRVRDSGEKLAPHARIQNLFAWETSEELQSEDAGSREQFVPWGHERREEAGGSKRMKSAPGGRGEGQDKVATPRREMWDVLGRL